MGFEGRGLTGRLRAGSRPVLSFSRWYAKDLPGPRTMRVSAQWVEWAPLGRHRLGGALVLELDMGEHVWYGKATIESVEPLVVRVEELNAR